MVLRLILDTTACSLYIQKFTVEALITRAQVSCKRARTHLS